jgi:DNA-binding MarR family transcriptional regulator
MRKAPVVVDAQAPRQAKHELPLRFGFLLHDVSRLRRTLFDQRLKPLGITRSQWWVLGHLSRAKGEPMSQVELARLLDVGKAALGGLIDRLERTGYVVRLDSPTDRRVKQVALTSKGKEFLSVIETAGRRLNAETTAGIDPKDLLRFEDVLDRMKRNLVERIRERD